MQCGAWVWKLISCGVYSDICFGQQVAQAYLSLEHD